MKMLKMDSVLMKAKFRGSLLGGLLGDCFGAPFEGDTYSSGMKLTVQRYFEKLHSPTFETPYKRFTDDTAMTISTGKCLVEKPPVDHKYMAQLFVQEYYADTRRGYGESVVTVFKKLKERKFDDIYGPASEQFGGSGSYGNGSAMRIAPVALFFHNNYNGMLDAVEKSTKITHTHRLGLHGSILQAIAVHQSLNLHPDEPLDVSKFAKDLQEKMSKIENLDNEGAESYKQQLKYLVELLGITNEEDPIKEEEVIGCLGNSVAALYSVPTAIYCFLKAHSGMPGIDSDNIFTRAIQYAVTLGGDSDTIASMTGAIAGAYFGEDIINQTLLKRCESHKEIQQLADDLFTASASLNASPDTLKEVA